MPNGINTRSSGGHEANAGGKSSAGETNLTATLTDATSGATGTVSFESASRCGNSYTEFNVSVTGAAASTTLDVAINGTVVGSLTTDANGAGTLELSSKDSTLPANFPTTLAAGDTVTVTNQTAGIALAGQLALPTGTGGDGDGSGGDEGGCGHVHGGTLSASLTDSAGTATGTVSLSQSKYGSSGTTFTVTVSGAAASAQLDVAINGTVLGQLTTDTTGAGTLTWSSSDSTLPANFPTKVKSGATVTVGTLSGTLDSSSDNSSGGSTGSLRHSHLETRHHHR
jgi:hypothetical protein